MPELTNEMIAEWLGWRYEPDPAWPERGVGLHWQSPDGWFKHGPTAPDWLHDIEAALRDVWPALCAISPGMSHDWRLRLANTGAWTFYREDDEPTRWYRARSLPELATQICRAYMAYKEAPDAHT